MAPFLMSFCTSSWINLTSSLLKFGEVGNFVWWRSDTKFFIIKVHFPNLHMGHEINLVTLHGLWNFYLHPKMGHQTYWQNLWFPPAHPSSYFMTSLLLSRNLHR
jgi:hypothetical protein